MERTWSLLLVWHLLCILWLAKVSLSKNLSWFSDVGLAFLKSLDCLVVEQRHRVPWCPFWWCVKPCFDFDNLCCHFLAVFHLKLSLLAIWSLHCRFYRLVSPPLPTLSLWHITTTIVRCVVSQANMQAKLQDTGITIYLVYWLHIFESLNSHPNVFCFFKQNINRLTLENRVQSLKKFHHSNFEIWEKWEVNVFSCVSVCLFTGGPMWPLPTMNWTLPYR